MVRKRSTLKKRRYIAAFIITALIFVLGFFAGLVIEGQRSAYLEDTYQQQRVEYSSMQLQQQLIEEIAKEENCQALQRTFDQNIKNLENARVRLESFQQDATLKQDDFDALAREYTHAQIRYYLLAQKNQELCGEDAATVLYFYSADENCPQCEDQAFVLTYLKRVMDEKLLIFSFNEMLRDQEPTIQILMNRYNITEFPAVVVNEQMHQGYIGRNNLTDELCGWFDQEHDFCQ